jgi:hypothetical protein
MDGGRMMTAHPGFGASDYVAFCAAMCVSPDWTLSPLARAASMPSWLSPELIATPAAVRKLQAWIASTPQPWEVPADPDTVLLEQRAVGDMRVARALAQLLCRLPPPLRGYSLSKICWVTAGLHVAGWCGPRPDMRRPRVWMIVLSARGFSEEKLTGLIVHELSHAWLLPEPAPGAVLSSAFEMDTALDSPNVSLAALASVTAVRQVYQRNEVLADALTRRLGFPV